LWLELIELSLGSERDSKSVICREVVTLNTGTLCDVLQFEKKIGANSAIVFLKYQTQMLK
jgi:hypothetical protein